MSRVREAMIVAGGEGTRLRPLTLTTPKPLLPFCGAPLLEGSIRRLADVGVRRVVLVVGSDPAPFAVLEPHARAFGVRLEVVAEPEPLGTAGGVRSALDRATGPFLVLNGDVLTDVDLAAVIDAHRARGADATLVLARVADTSAYGVCVLRGTRVVAFVEKPAPGTLTDQDTVNAGTYVLEPEVLAGFPTGPLSFERTVFPALVAEGARVEGFVSDAIWEDVGTPERFLRAHRLALDGALVWPTLQRAPTGVSLAPGAVADEGAELVPPVLLCAGARVDPGARVGPYAVVGERGHVASTGVVTDSVLFDDAVVEAPVTRLIAGRGAHVRSGAVVGADVVLGDAVVVDAGERVAAGTRRPPSR